MVLMTLLLPMTTQAQAPIDSSEAEQVVPALPDDTALESTEWTPNDYLMVGLIGLSLVGMIGLLITAFVMSKNYPPETVEKVVGTALGGVKSLLNYARPATIAIPGTLDDTLLEGADELLDLLDRANQAKALGDTKGFIIWLAKEADLDIVALIRELQQHVKS